MSQINATAASARESARTTDGRFGSYSTGEADGVELSDDSASSGRGGLRRGESVTFTGPDGQDVTGTVANLAPLGGSASTAYFVQDRRGRTWEVGTDGPAVKTFADPYALRMRAAAIESLHTRDVEWVTPADQPTGPPRSGLHVAGCQSASHGVPGARHEPVSRTGEAERDLVRRTRSRSSTPPCRCLTGGEAYQSGGAHDRALASVSPDIGPEDVTIAQVAARTRGDTLTADQREHLRRECPDVDQASLDEFASRARMWERLAALPHESEDWHQDFYDDPRFRDELSSVTGDRDDEEEREAWAEYLHENARSEMRSLIEADDQASRTPTGA